ncbi:MAG: hypothetical protein KDE33_25585, partial [Bacteroidetes bacterium]|nr:hypothetical protein [Bacteroidota bacterium]
PENSKLTSFNERIKYVNYWARIINENRELYKSLDEQFIRRVKIIPFEKILESVVTFNQEKDIQEKMSINKFLPRLSSLMGIKEEPLTNIYYLSEGVRAKTFNYLCVIGYDAYFDMSEQSEMLRYFKQFSEKLKGASITRIFSIPAKRKKSKGWTSILDKPINELLYQYIQSNISSGVETFVMLYDEEKSLNNNNILWHQDYVIRFKKMHFNSLNESLLTAVLNNDEFVTKRNIIEDKDTELYFAYPERSDGKNMLLRLSSLNNIDNSNDLVQPLTESNTIYDKFANNIYIEHIYSDFLHRAKLLNDDRPYLKLMKCSDDKVDELKKNLNL